MSMATKYGMKRRAKKMAKGGAAEEDRSKMSGHSGMVRTDTEANQNHKGVHQHGYKGSSGGNSQAGAFLRDSAHGLKGGKESAKEIHKGTLSELRSMKKPNLMAEGGMAKDHAWSQKDKEDFAKGASSGSSLDLASAAKNIGHLFGLAEGGEADDDMVGRIMSKRMAHGGVVSNEDEMHADELPNEFDDLVLDDHLESYIDSDSEHGDARLNEDEHDVVSRIMKSRAKKDRNPRPA